MHSEQIAGEGGECMYGEAIELDQVRDISSGSQGGAGEE